MNKVVAPSEPVAAELNFSDKSYQIKLITAFNWYNTEKDKKDARKYLEDYAKRTGVVLGSFTDNDIVLTLCWAARLANKGATLSPSHLQKLNDYVSRLAVVKKVVQQSTSPRVSIQEATQNKINTYLGELEGVFDDLAKDPTKDFSLIDDLKKNQLPQTAATDIDSWVKGKLRELITVYEGKDKELVEGYSNFKRKQLIAFIKKLSTFIEDANKYSAFKKANRKPREKKVKSAAVQVKSIKYKFKDDELNITSVAPTNIVGSQQVWVYNAKTRKIAVYRTESALGIQVKGTSLQNYEPDLSTQKTLRKPAEQLKELLAAGKVQLRKFMDNIKAVASVPSGRLNADTLILRCIR